MKPKPVNIYRYKFHLCPTLLGCQESNPGLSALCPTTLPHGYQNFNDYNFLIFKIFQWLLAWLIDNLHSPTKNTH